ncbi:TVP38/TMEM64 family protein [Fictibacillus sp. KU28468]|uniref:TVP38/TMEM64 family protein n=1 Tax=Fictibacillus sp. KU28468 TaxID=2991053 RepID=UPI00223E0928|nr:VTT domain-containing protein [Fictibacillus sp. KU28468]UZJ80347.1 VTT domain-containing protein [Fictibacillus sp. KU28468]
MQHELTEILGVLKFAGIFAPVFFILLHMMRQFLFLPVGLICMAGGVLFGSVYGTLYSIIGITLSSLLFYGLLRKMPKSLNRFMKIKRKIVGKRMPFSLGQIAILKLIPFIHFSLLSLFVLEITKSFKEYTKASVVSNVPLAFMYSTFGHYIFHLSVVWGIGIAAMMLVLFHLLRKKEWIVKWEDFFEKKENTPAKSA